MKPAWSSDARTGPVRNYMNLKIFACEGLICIIDENPGAKEGEYTVVLPNDLERRVKAINEPYRGQTRIDLPVWKRQEFDAQVRGSQNCMECIKEARAMGDPSDERTQLWWEKHRRNSSFHFSFSAGSNPEGYPTLPEIPLGNITGRTADVGSTIHDLVDSNVAHIHKPPRRKRSGLIILD